MNTTSQPDATGLAISLFPGKQCTPQKTMGRLGGRPKSLLLKSAFKSDDVREEGEQHNDCNWHA